MIVLQRYEDEHMNTFVNGYWKKAYKIVNCAICTLHDTLIYTCDVYCFQCRPNFICQAFTVVSVVVVIM